ncbi:hypothetical protein C8A00DRAFT_37479 [Chaetomidium leptoderma]|uniref:Isopenicillin N synthase-like Fe(2+) 2OG dioxygenase domain-containing protein n=1 Tax=Chaetomidium leptoderma TaxID=669021 RepID=A0AAN6VFK7_9PEZI|nr:hypothetical protein C8A00DRAFT_37479 [Chaetomidium leptoderma]
MPAAKTPQAEAVAPLATIDVEKLLLRDPQTAEELLHAAESPGFFYADLRGPSFKDMLPDIEALLALSHSYFEQSQNAKGPHFRTGIDRGYKPGKGHESFEFATTELQEKALVFPGMLGAHEAVLARFTEQCDKATKTLLRSLLSSIGKPELEATMLANPGDSGLKFISAPTSARREDAPNTTHTDSGILTFLWCPQLSSQIRDPHTREWAWVEPKEGCAIVNVADALQGLTGGQLHSCVHRVLQPGDGVEERHFLSYYLRPSNA